MIGFGLLLVIGVVVLVVFLSRRTHTAEPVAHTPELGRYRSDDPAVAARHVGWAREAGDPALAARRQELAQVLGLPRDARPQPDGFEYHDVLAEPRAEAPGFRVHPVRWQAFGHVHGTGLLLEPKTTPAANVIVVPDASQTAEDLARNIRAVVAEMSTITFAGEPA